MDDNEDVGIEINDQKSQKNGCAIGFNLSTSFEF